MENIFIKTLLTDKIKVRPKDINRGIRNHLERLVKAQYEGKCSYHGYIKTGSVSIFKHSLGQIQAFSLNGTVVYNVQYHAEVCNPATGSIVKARVVNTNKFGILAESGTHVNNVFTPILEIIIAKNSIEIAHDVNVEHLKVGDVINVEIMGKKYELHDKKISIVGRIVTHVPSRNNTATATELPDSTTLRVLVDGEEDDTDDKDVAVVPEEEDVDEDEDDGDKEDSLEGDDETVDETESEGDGDEEDAFSGEDMFSDGDSDGGDDSAGDSSDEE
jgi:DNA-directed RNA polymerase subunit E'/Rpb7